MALDLICAVLGVAVWVIIAWIVLSYVVNYGRLGWDHPVRRFYDALSRVVEPVMRPIRNVIPPLRIGGAALDVVEKEPLPPDSALLGRDNVILSPHTAFYSVESLDELQAKAASDAARVLSGDDPIYPISAG